MVNYKIGENKYGKYCVPILDPSRKEIDTILAGEVHEQDTIDCMLSHSKGNGIVHAGTFFGDMLPVLSNNFKTVWAFEPFLMVYECAQKTIELNDLNNIVFKHCGLSNRDGHAYIKTGNKQGKSTGSSCRISHQGDGITERIGTVCIDSQVPQDEVIDVIHLDVEGSELKALHGAKKTIERCNPVIILETRGIQRDQFADFLVPLGYKLIDTTHPTPNVPNGVNTVWKYGE